MPSSIVKSLFILIACVVFPFTSAAQKQPLRTLLLEIRGVDPAVLKGTPLVYDDYVRDAVLSDVRGRKLVLATRAEADLLRERGVPFSVLLEDSSQITLAKRALYGPSMRMPGIYHTYERMMAEVDSLAASHPHLIRKFPIGKTEQEGRTIFAVKITEGVEKRQDKPAILFDGCHHSDEVMGGEICMALIHELAAKQGMDPAVDDWLKRFVIVVVPVVNVDGHTVVTHNVDPRWRKNTHDTNGNGILHEFPEGVDLNRNYDFNWAHGGSDDSMSERYRGAYPFSEAENRAMRQLAMSERFLCSISYHSQGEVIYYPWSWSGKKAPDDVLLTSIAGELASSIRTMAGDTCYKAEYGAGTVGQTYPWLYGVLGTFDFIIETGKGAAIFPEEEVPGIIKSNLAGVHYFLNRAKGPGLTGHVLDARSGKPLEANVWFPAIETEDVRRRTSEPAFGRYSRLLLPGKYFLIVSCEGYRPKVLKDVEVQKGEWTTLDVQLEPVDRISRSDPH
jgi:carboxypeptidase T